MKKLVLLAFIFSPLTHSLADTITTKSYPASSKSCSGSGICTVTTTSSNVEGYITTQWTLNDVQLIMRIPEETISDVPGDLMDQLDSGRFIMDESFTFPLDISIQLGSSSEIIIPAGVYTATHTSDGYTVQFTIE